MRKAITYLLTAVVLFVASFAGARAHIESTQPEYLGFVLLQQEENFAAKYKAWFQTCDYTPYSCIGVKVPKVVTEWMRYGLLGYYNGTDTVYINRRLRGQQLNEVLMHEMVHYLQVQRGGLDVPGYSVDICRAEEEAFSITDQWLIDHGYADLIRGEEWWQPYRHCWKFYKPGWIDYSEDFGGWIWRTGPSM